MEHFQPGSIWLDMLPTAVQSRVTLHVTGGELNGQAVNLAKLSCKWAGLAWNAAERAVDRTISLEWKTDEEMEAQLQVGKEAREAHEKLLFLIKCFADSETDDFHEVCDKHTENASKILRGMKVTCVDIPVQMNLMNDVFASSCIEELYLNVCDSSIHQILEQVEDFASFVQRLTSLPLKVLCFDGEFGHYYRDMRVPAALVSCFAALAAKSSSACDLGWNIQPRQSSYQWFGDPDNIFENYWKSIELLPAAARVVLYYPPPERLLEKLGSLASLDIRTSLLSSRAFSRLGKIVEDYNGGFGSCQERAREGYAELGSLLHCTQMKELGVTGCWHLLAKLAPVIKSMGSLRELVLNVNTVGILGISGGRCNACEEDPDYLPRTSQLFESIPPTVEVHFTGCEITRSECRQVLKLPGTKLRRLILHGLFDSRSDLMDYVEELLLTLLSYNPNIHSLATPFSWDFPENPENRRSCTSQDRRIRMLAKKLQQRQPLLHYENWVIDTLSFPVHPVQFID